MTPEIEFLIRLTYEEAVSGAELNEGEAGAERTWENFCLSIACSSPGRRKVKKSLIRKARGSINQKKMIKLHGVQNTVYV
jgi:hypothetical protein